jgi:NADPH:quinone reductase-like Zn-dependent oxidoreductase
VELRQLATFVKIDRSFELSDATAAHAYAESRKAFGRVVIEP